MFAVPLGGMKAASPAIRYPTQLVRYVQAEYGDPNPEWLIARAAELGNRSHVEVGWGGKEKAALKVQETVALS